MLALAWEYCSDFIHVHIDLHYRHRAAIQSHKLTWWPWSLCPSLVSSSLSLWPSPASCHSLVPQPSFPAPGMSLPPFQSLTLPPCEHHKTLASKRDRIFSSTKWWREGGKICSKVLPTKGTFRFLIGVKLSSKCSFFKHLKTLIMTCFCLYCGLGICFWTARVLLHYFSKILTTQIFANELLLFLLEISPTVLFTSAWSH